IPEQLDQVAGGDEAAGVVGVLPAHKAAQGGLDHAGTSWRGRRAGPPCRAAPRTRGMVAVGAGLAGAGETSVRERPIRPTAEWGAGALSVWREWSCGALLAAVRNVGVAGACESGRAARSS